jgi:intracellular multiplication protein IcmD
MLKGEINMTTRKNKLNKSNIIRIGVTIGLLTFAGAALALTLGTMASKITATFADIGKLITAGSYVAGLAFAVGAIMKFKQHKDNPTQIPIGTPISLVLIAAALLFMPTLLKTLGSTMFGTATTAGSGGVSIGGTS